MSPPFAFALFTYLLCFQQLLEEVHSGTSLSPWACFTADFPVLLFSLPDHVYEEKGSGQCLSSPLLQHAWMEQRLTASPGLPCCCGPTLSLWQCNTHPAFLTEAGVPEGEGSPWCCLGQLPCPALEGVCWASPSSASYLCKLRDVEDSG